MGTGITFVVIGLMLATLGVLIAGIVVMARGGETNQKYGNKMMVLRVALQAMAIALVAVLMMLKH